MVICPEQVPVVVDHTCCNANEDINFRLTGFTLHGRVVGAVGGDSCVHKSGGPSNVNVELLSSNGDVVSSVLTSSTGSYLFKNIIPGKYNIRASHLDLNIEVKGSAEVELGFDNGVVDDIFFVSDYDIHGLVVAQIGYEDVKDLDFVVFEQPDMTILSGHVEGKNIKEMHSHIRVEIRPASDPSAVESIFPLPISNFFQVKDLPKGKHLLQLRSALPSGNHRFVSEVIEIDLERQPQIHVGPLSFRIEEDMYKQELTPAPVYPLVVGLSVIALFISMPRLKDLYQATVGISFPGSSAAAKKDIKKLGIRKKTY